MPGAINPADITTLLVSKIDAQQRIVSLLESELQNSILGSDKTSKQNILNEIREIYNSTIPSVPGTIASYMSAITESISNFGELIGSDASPVEQDLIRHMLYQARALLGEFRLEEQSWSQELMSEKTLRKEVNDFAKT